MGRDDETSARHSSSKSLLAIRAEIFSCCFGLEHLGPAGAASPPSPCSPHLGVGGERLHPMGQQLCSAVEKGMCHLGVAEGTAGGAGLVGGEGFQEFQMEPTSLEEKVVWEMHRSEE